MYSVNQIKQSISSSGDKLYKISMKLISFLLILSIGFNSLGILTVRAESVQKLSAALFPYTSYRTKIMIEDEINGNKLYEICLLSNGIALNDGRFINKDIARFYIDENEEIVTDIEVIKKLEKAFLLMHQRFNEISWTKEEEIQDVFKLIFDDKVITALFQGLGALAANIVNPASFKNYLKEYIEIGDLKDLDDKVLGNIVLIYLRWMLGVAEVEYQETQILITNKLYNASSSLGYVFYDDCLEILEHFANAEQIYSYAMSYLKNTEEYTKIINFPDDFFHGLWETTKMIVWEGVIVPNLEDIFSYKRLDKPLSVLYGNGFVNSITELDPDSFAFTTGLIREIILNDYIGVEEIVNNIIGESSNFDVLMNRRIPKKVAELYSLSKAVHDTDVKSMYLDLTGDIPYNIAQILTDSVRVKVMLNGERVNFSVPPINENGRIYVPAREIFETVGFSIDWNNATKTLTASNGSTTIEHTIETNFLTVNGERKTFDFSSIIVDGRSLMSVRMIADAIGASIDWDNNENTVFINKTTKVSNNEKEIDKVISCVDDFFKYMSAGEYNKAQNILNDKSYINKIKQFDFLSTLGYSTEVELIEQIDKERWVLRATLYESIVMTDGTTEKFMLQICIVMVVKKGVEYLIYEMDYVISI